MSAPDEEFLVDAGSPFAEALKAARKAFTGRVLAVMDERYRQAVRLAPRQPTTARTAVAVEHLSRLRILNDSTRALARCTEYLAEDGENVTLRLWRAETELTRNDYSRLDTELTTIRQITGGRPPRPVDDALLHRLEGRAAAHHGTWSLAERHLHRARDGFAALGDTAAVAAVDSDFHDLAVCRGEAASRSPGGPEHRSASGPEPSLQDRLTRSEELRQPGDYEPALAELDLVLAGPLDPAMTFFVLYAKVRLLLLLRDDDQAEALMTALYDAATASAQPAENLVAAQRLAGDLGPGELVAPGHRLQHARRLVQDGRLREAEQLLRATVSSPEPDDRHAALWNLAAAELTLAVADRPRTSAPDRPCAEDLRRKAIDHLQQCLRHASAATLIAIRITAQRLLGNVHAALEEMDCAAASWKIAHELEEWVSARQPSDHHRIRMLRAAPDEFDERVRVAARAVNDDQPWTVAAIAVAIEAARGAAILPRILPDREPLVRELPGPGDSAGARRWLRRTVRGLPRSQIIWMLHATPEHVHHVFIQRTLRQVHLRHVPVPCTRHELITSITALTSCWKTGHDLEDTLEKGTFDEKLRDVEKQLGFKNLFKTESGSEQREQHLLDLPRRFERIAVVAGGELSEIPFALLPCPGQPDELIGRRYALSDLPCLSVRRPLRRRSRGQRGIHGRRMLLVRGPDDPESRPLTPAAEVRGRTSLTDQAATPETLRAELRSGRYRQVRIDSHGEYQHDNTNRSDDPNRADDPKRAKDPAPPVIHLYPEGPAGDMSPDEFQSMRLDATGTLVLGACETGMARRIGRDERTGFVRAGLLSGASAVLAARWEALDTVAARVIDQFERNLRHYPRDVALFLAQREEDTRGRNADPEPKSATEAHPVRWAAWTLYGDTGYQARLGPPRRWLSKWLGCLHHAVMRTTLFKPKPTPGGQR